MTSANDPVVLEMIATCEHFAEGYSTALQAIEQLATAQLEGRTMTEAALIRASRICREGSDGAGAIPRQARAA